MTAAMFFGEVRRHWLLFGAVVATCVGIGVGVSVLTPARYVSTTQLLVSSHASVTATSYDESAAVWDRVNSYVALLTSDVVGQRVVDALGLPMSAKEFAADVNPTIVPPRTSVIDVAVSAGSPEEAQRRADAVAGEFVTYTKALEGPAGVDSQRIETTVVSAASEPHRSLPGTWAFALLGLVTGLVLGCVAVWIRSRLDPVVRTPDRAAGVSGLPVVGTVVHGPVTGEDNEGYFRLRARLRTVPGRPGAHAESRMWVITSAAGEAVEASDVATNLGRVLARYGDHVLLVRTADSDPGDDGPGLSDVLTGPDRIDQSIRVEAAGSPDLLPAGSAADVHELLVGGGMRELVTRLRGRYRHLVVDSEPVLSTPSAEVLSEYADGVLVVVVTGTTTRRDLAAAVDRLRAIDAPLTGIVACEPSVTGPAEVLPPAATGSDRDVPNKLQV
ncbi:Wzz/FepE/Etk N-terminal domain-containing protein [Rhodococcus sp. NPDC003318]|uniref:Wzz/FepE/Etk N-terminal domain-containing protein n=1 Tax=Rhodococcus sp. NPDC003318 TaxID=3364503 RepID=UPI0036C382BD